MMQTPTIIHNGTPYDVDLDMFLYLSPLLQELYYKNSYNRPMYITDGLSAPDFQNLVTSINNRNCINVINTNNTQEVFSFLQTCLVYHIRQFIEDSCQFIINHHKKYIINALMLISQYEEISINLDQYIISNLKSFCKKTQFFEVDYFSLQRLFENANRKADISKDLDIVSFIVNYVKTNQKKECCFLFQFTNFQTIYDIDNGVLLEDLINKDLIDFDFLGEKIVRDLKKGSSTKSSTTSNINGNKKLASKQIELLESKINKTEKECKEELEKIEEMKNEQENLQAESTKVESTLNTVTKQSLNASSKIALLQKEKAELEQKLADLIQQEEESKMAKYEEEEPEKTSETSNTENNSNHTENNTNSELTTSKSGTIQEIPSEKSAPSTQNEQNTSNTQQSQQQQSDGPLMPHWCPKAKLNPPDMPFNEDTFYTNIKKADKEMKIYPTEALRSCFAIFGIDIKDNDENNFSTKINLIDPNDRATMFDFLARYSIEFNQPEISASLASLLVATDYSCDDLAASLFLNAAEKNVPEAMLNIGVMSRLGRGVIQDDKMAAHMIVKAANIGLNEAISIVKAACS